VSTTLEQFKTAIPGLDIRPVTGRIGAVIRGLHLNGDVPDATIDAIEAALLKYRVVFIPGQQHLSETEQERFAARFGELVSHPTVPSLEGTEHILDVDGSKNGRATSWHADITFVSDYPKITFLRSLVAPEIGGDTAFTNTIAAYEDLHPGLKALADQLWTLHTNDYDYSASRPAPRGVQQTHYEEVFTAKVFETTHPLVRVHPITGERSLLLGNFIKKILDIPGADSQLLLKLFEQHALRPENQVRWRWTVGDLAIWDNRATLHRAIDDYGDQARIVRRSTVRGEVPVSVDGRLSSTRVTKQQAS
jgi:taurine dioxygenase